MTISESTGVLQLSWMPNELGRFMASGAADRLPQDGVNVSCIVICVCVCVYVCAEERVNEKCIYARWVMVHFRVSIMGSNYRCRIIGVRREIGAPVQE